MFKILDVVERVSATFKNWFTDTGLYLFVIFSISTQHRLLFSAMHLKQGDPKPHFNANRLTLIGFLTIKLNMTW
ncbi:unnamed protein product [Heterobilharzia americana]|nr:unnamed protein product [Heterobilharzia americana]